MLSNGEYVIRAKAVDALGLGFLNKVNKGIVPGYAMGGMIGPTPSVPQAEPMLTGSGDTIAVTYNEVREKPRPEDLVRAVGSAKFLGRV